MFLSYKFFNNTDSYIINIYMIEVNDDFKSKWEGVKKA